jgi:hypothetical protein
MYGSENSGSFINGILDAIYLKVYKDQADENINGLTGSSHS